MSLHLYHIGDCDTVVASDEADAWKVWKEYCGLEPEEADWQVEAIPDSKVVRIRTDEGAAAPVEQHTAAEWATQEGRGFLCSTEC